MGCFIKKIFEERIDGKVHNQFTRFGKGRYEKRALISLQKNSKIKLKGSFEYANDFVEQVSELGNFNFSGLILSKEALDLENEKKKAGMLVYEVRELSSNKIKELKDKAYYMLLDAESPDLILKIKKKLPKPGKSGEGRIDDKFCMLEADLRHYGKIKEAFFWDAPECKKVKAEHDYLISSLNIPKDEKDFELIRLKTKRKGRLIRRLEADKKPAERGKEFEA